MKKPVPLEFEGEKIYLKKDFLGTRVVHPPKNEDGSWNWFNLLTGGWNNFILLLFILFLVLGFFYVYNHDTVEMQKVVENPCAYCPGCGDFGITNISNITLDDSFGGDLFGEQKKD